MYVYDTTPVCIHVSSVTSFDPNSGEFVEVGWIDLANGLVYPDNPTVNCAVVGDGTPHWYSTHLRNGTFYCVDLGPISSGTYHGFGVSNRTGDDQWWSWKCCGQPLGTNPVAMDFSLSQSLTNGERYGATESAAATFGGLKYVPFQGVWTDWPSSSGYFDNDPSYRNCFYSATSLDVLNVTTCPT
jgi:hypothetical protein